MVIEPEKSFPKKLVFSVTEKDLFWRATNRRTVGTPLTNGTQSKYQAKKTHSCTDFLGWNFLRLGNAAFRLSNEPVRVLGKYATSNLDWTYYCNLVYERAIRVANCVLQSLRHSCLCHYPLVFVVYCRPLLGYCTQVWSPFKASDVKCIEKARKYFTRLAFRKSCPWPFTNWL